MPQLVPQVTFARCSALRRERSGPVHIVACPTPSEAGPGLVEAFVASGALLSCMKPQMMNQHGSVAGCHTGCSDIVARLQNLHSPIATVGLKFPLGFCSSLVLRPSFSSPCIVSWGSGRATVRCTVRVLYCTVRTRSPEQVPSWCCESARSSVGATASRFGQRHPPRLRDVVRFAMAPS
jgi:hypothetical protein